MPEILTESFCERCGTRYTFETVTPKVRPLTKLRVLSKGLKNYVLSDESSLDEAFADARSDEERSISSQQLDAFHKTFNFCMTCRQYTCGNCWNGPEGRCLTCAPHLGQEILPGPFPTVDLAVAPSAGGNGHVAEEMPTFAASAWPVVDLRPTDPEPLAETATVAGPGAEGFAAEVFAADPAPIEGAEAVALEAIALHAVAPDAVAADAVTADAVPSDAVEIGPAQDGQPIHAAEAEPAPDTGAETGGGDVETVVAIEPTPALAAAPTEIRPETPAIAARSAASVAGGVIVPEGTSELPEAAPSHDQAAAVLKTSLFARFRIHREHPAEAAAAGSAPGSVEAPESPVGAAPLVGPETAPLPGVAAGVAAAAVVAGGPDEQIPLEAASKPSAPSQEEAPAAAAGSEGLTPAELAAVSLATAAAVARRASLPTSPPPPARRVPDVGQAASPAASAVPTAAGALPAPEPVATAPEPVATAPAPEPAPPPVPAPLPAPAPKPAPAQVPAARPDDVVEMPTWRIVAPDTSDGVPAPPPSAPPPVPATPGAGPAQVPAAPPAQPIWPVQQGEPQWPTGTAESLTPPAPWARPAASAATAASFPTGPSAAEGVWTASSRDVLDRAGSGVQACVSCGLPLSATARFCRRCGTRQG